MMLSGEEIDMTEPVDFNRYYREKIEAASNRWTSRIAEISIQQWKEALNGLSDRMVSTFPVPSPLFFECGNTQCAVCYPDTDYEE